jgi:dihydrofolate reductase
MAKLIYSAITSLDGYVADAEGRFDWSAPDEEVHSFVNDVARPIGTYLFGRRMYEVLAPWETMDTTDQPLPIGTTPRSGVRPTRSCTRDRSTRFPARGRDSNGASTPRRCAR